MTAPDIRPQLTSSLTLAAVPTAAGVARSFVRQRLSQWGLNRLAEDAELVLSELVANAVTATGTTNPRPRWGDLQNLALIGVRLVVTVDSLVIEVWDRSPSPPVPKLPEQADEEGRGLLIVDALCRRWNYFYPESGGKAVWGELVVPAYDLIPAGLAAACEILSPAQLQKRRRDKARKARAKARTASKKARAERGRSKKQQRAAAKKARKVAAAAAAAVAGGRAKLPAGSVFGRIPVPAGHPVLPAAVYGDPRHVPALRGLGADGKASRGAKLTGQEAPQHLGFFWHDTRLNAAQRGVDRKTNETTVIGPVIDRMDLAGVCLTVDALHSLADLGKRVLARDGHVIFVIKGNQPRTYQALDAIAWEQIPVAAATFEADRGRVETRSIQVSAAPAGLKYPGMKQAALIERYTTFKDKNGTAVTRSETVLILTTATAEQAPPADLLALNRGHWAATEITHYIRDTGMNEDASRARAPGAARFMATAGNTVLSLLRIHGVTNIAAERRRLSGSNRKILKRMGLSPA